MKITKTKKVETITEEIEILDGTYYFSYGYKEEEPYEFYKIEIDNAKYPLHKDYTNLVTTRVTNSFGEYLVSYTENHTDYLGTLVEWYFKGEWDNDEQEIKEISAKEFEKQKLEVINKIINEYNQIKNK